MQARAQLTEVIELVTKELENYEAKWQATKLPKLQARSHRLWRKGQDEGHRGDWQWNLDRCKASTVPLFAFCSDAYSPSAQQCSTYFREESIGILLVSVKYLQQCS